MSVETIIQDLKDRVAELNREVTFLKNENYMLHARNEGYMKQQDIDRAEIDSLRHLCVEILNTKCSPKKVVVSDIDNEVEDNVVV